MCRGAPVFCACDAVTDIWSAHARAAAAARPTTGEPAIAPGISSAHGFSRLPRVTGPFAPSRFRRRGVACPALPCCPTNGGSAKSVDLKNTGPLSCTGQHSNSFAFPYWSRVQSLVKTRFAQLLEQFTTLLVLLFLLGRDRPSSRQVVHVHKTKNTFTVVQCGTGHRAVLACWGTQTEGENAPGVSELCTNAQRFHCPTFPQCM